VNPTVVVNPPPVASLISYPVVAALSVCFAMTAILLVVVKYFDPTMGALTISLLITLGMLGAIAYCLIFTVPVDDITPSVVGGLTAGFGAMLTYWFGRGKG
jgi:hypothetical protein